MPPAFLLERSMTNHCQECTACCFVYTIPELQKPAGKWCDKCHIGHGCKIYEARPKVCERFECLWLLSQKYGESAAKMAPELRPDRCHVVIGPATDPTVYTFNMLPGYYDAWRKPGVQKIIKRMIQRGLYAVMNTAVLTRKIIVDIHGEREIEMTEPDVNGLQWNVEKKA